MRPPLGASFFKSGWLMTISFVSRVRQTSKHPATLSTVSLLHSREKKVCHLHLPNKIPEKGIDPEEKSPGSAKPLPDDQ
jgi:hypothetical protein